MSEFGFLFLIIIGFIMLISNTYESKYANEKRDELYYPSGYLYVLNALIGFMMILIALELI